MKKERKQIEERVAADTSRLYGDIDKAIEYLREIRDQYREFDISLDEHWTGYEDMEMTFVYFRDETDIEMAARLDHEAFLKKAARMEAARQKQRKVDLAEFNALRKKLGL